ncbi:MAG: ATP-binding protein [Deltaproteobacteria bacterium]|nr:MAG: ATP-binding protein [Deltaproteobacteria bacterium]
MNRLRLPAVMESLDLFRSFLEQELERLGLDPARRLEIELVLEELLTNIIRYAYAGGRGEVEVSYFLEGRLRFCLALRDWGRGFNPLESASPDLALNLEQRPLGGLGLYLAGQLADKIKYQYEAGANQVTLCFDLAQPAAVS